jgi:small subunit ribosomal protein S4
VKAGDVVTVREKSRANTRITEALEASQRRGIPDWLDVDRQSFTGKVKQLPLRADLTTPINEKLVVELYSK